MWIAFQAIRLLTEELGVVDAIRFVNQFSTGHGNYTEERDSLFGKMTMSDILSAVQKQRADTGPQS